MTPRRLPLDEVLVDRDLAADLEVARALVLAHRVLVAGVVAESATRRVAPDEPVRVLEPARYVGRGGEKLEGALGRFGCDVTGVLALDAGASTGGFTDCLLAHGARRVLAVDVGHGQLHERLRDDARVLVLERTNLRDLSPDDAAGLLGGPPGLVTVDLSFTSLVPHAAGLVGLAGEHADLLALVKPQFEVDHATASRGRGVVRDPSAWRASLEAVASAVERAGAGIMGAMASPLSGASGNVEFFLWARRGRRGATDLGRQLDAALAEAGRP